MTRKQQRVKLEAIHTLQITWIPALPDHKVVEQRLGERVQVCVDGDNIADLADVIKVEEDGFPARYYFPRQDVRMDRLEPSAMTSECPFKGVARYFDVNVGGQRIKTLCGATRVRTMSITT